MGKTASGDITARSDRDQFLRVETPSSDSVKIMAARLHADVTAYHSTNSESQ